MAKVDRCTNGHIMQYDRTEDGATVMKCAVCGHEEAYRP